MADVSKIRKFADAADYTKRFIVQAEIDKYLPGGKHFIDDALISSLVAKMDSEPADPAKVREIISKAESTCETLLPEETAELMKVKDPALFEEMRAAADRIKRKVYDNRIVVFAPLYMSNLCVNGCKYCGFREGNAAQKRRVLTMDELKEEIDVLAGRIGHKRLIAVYGEHPTTSTEYIAETIETCYNRQVKAPKTGAPVGIRRVNVNAAPLPVEDLKVLRSVGIGTFQMIVRNRLQTFRKDAIQMLMILLPIIMLSRFSLIFSSSLSNLLLTALTFLPSKPMTIYLERI